MEKIISTKELENSYRCIICDEFYNEKNKKPSCLVPCGHTICQECINSLSNNNCPTCRTEFNKNVTNWETLKTMNQVFHSKENHKSNTYDKNDLNDNPQNNALETEFSNYDERLKSFKNWPANLKQTPIKLANVGFYYIGGDDKVKCYKCGVILYRWEDDDDPFEGHQEHSPNCEHLKVIEDQVNY
jgi:hypothetical protein